MNDAKFESFANILSPLGNCCSFSLMAVESFPSASMPSQSMALASTRTSTPCGTKCKVVMVDVTDTQFDKFNTGLDNVVEAIGCGSVYALKQSNVAEKQVNISECQVIAIEK